MPQSHAAVPGDSKGTDPAPFPNLTRPTTELAQNGPKMAENGTKKTKGEKEYHFKLTAVAYNEAALDLPLFRASVNHLDTQLAQTEDWFMALANLFLKVPKKIEEFSSVYTILDYLVPSFLQDSLVDQEYCLATLYESRKTLKSLWATAFSVFKINVSTLENRKVEFALRVARYRRLKRRFLACQEKYDHYHEIHMGTPKYKDARLFYEDSLQLAQVRREYVLLSLELVCETQRLVHNINKTILALNELFWKIKIENLGGGLLDQAQLDDVWLLVRRVRAWHDACEGANTNLAAEMKQARQGVEKEAASIEPLLPQDFRPDFINSRVLDDINEPAAEKYGYLCMKTFSEKSLKPVWIRRWAFVQNGVLGFLVLSPSLESVQETDKIGVLLCNVKYAPNEDRHFCFEIKTIDTTITLQAETLHELKLWLKVFENARTRIIDETHEMHALLDVASSRYPPTISEFLAATNTPTDREITSKRTFNSVGHMVTSKKLSRHLEQNEAFFQKYIFDSIGRIHLPVVTSATRSALIAASLADAPAFPTALEANIAGLVNLALTSMGPRKGPFLVEDLQPAQTKQVGGGIIYPHNFPNAWIAKDLQMRALFGATVGPNEYCLVSYNCLLSPNESQELRATHFVTQINLYSYIHTLGFVSMAKVPLNKFVEATCVSSKRQDIVRLILVHGQLVMKLFLDNGMLVERKLNFLFENLASDLPMGTVDTISQILAIEEKFAQDEKAAKAKPTLTGSPTHFEYVNAGAKSQALESFNFENKLPKLATRTVNLPAKAVFHVLCGSESAILNALNAMVEVQSSERSLWRKSPNESDYLIRDNVSVFRLPTGQSGKLCVKQEIEIHAENEFYSIKVTKLALKVTCGPRLLFVTRVTIQRLEAERCAVKIYGEPVISGTPFYTSVTQRLCRVFLKGFTRHVFKEIDVSTNIIGSKGKILKAVYFYGKILVAHDPYEPLEIDPVPVGRITLFKMSLQLMAADAVRGLTTWCFVVVNAVKYVLRQVSLHAGLFGVIALLMLSNIYLSGLSARNYWLSRQSGILAKELLTTEPVTIQRAIYSRDVQDLINDKIALSEGSACFQVFKNESVVLNYYKYTGWNGLFQQPVSLKRQDLRDKLHAIARERNDLLVSLKMLNHLEEEEAKAEWQDWLLDELATCSQIVGQTFFTQESSELNSTMEVLGKYCDSCSRELAGVSGIF